MIVPPILFIAYSAQSLIVIRGLLSGSSKFHIDYANDLVQEYLAMTIALDIEHLKYCIADEDPCADLDWLTTAPSGSPLAVISVPDHDPVSVYLNPDKLPGTLFRFFNGKKGLKSLFVRREHHEPVYWFRILDPDGEPVYQAGERPRQRDAFAVYAMDGSLKGYRLEMIYNSFGAKQLYAVSRQKINFAAIFFLFILATFSVFLVTRAIRQKIVMARQKTFFVTTVSHEFKTPLAIMKLAADTLEAKRFKSPDEEQRFLRMLDNEINRLNHLVQKILNFSKIEMGQIHYRHEAIDLKDLLRSSLEIFQTKAVAEGITLAVDLCRESCPITGDPELIRHAIDNILDNAFKYRGDSDRIEVGCLREGGEIRLTVKDYGIGIAREELPHIVKSFYRINDPRVQGIRGSGLGLAISNYLLKYNKAVLTVVSELSKGSTFTITFPIRQRE